MLTKRQLMILQEIIRLYSETDQPVGSKTLMNELPVHISSATIRNEMADLEGLGLIEKTHSSSGRVPSTAGYRYYLSNIIQPMAVNPVDVALVQQSFGKQYHRLDEIVAQSAKILSDLTNYTAITLGPEVNQISLTGFRLVPLNHYQVIAIIVTSAGTVDNQVFNISPDISSEELEKIVRIINDQLVGLPLQTVSHKLKFEMPQIFAKYVQTSTGFLNVFDDILKKAAQEKVYVGGQMNLLNFSQFDDLADFKNLYQTMNQNETLKDLLRVSKTRSNPGQVQILLGDELANEIFRNYSLMTVDYNVGKHGQGTIALLGPTSMPYSKMIGLLDVFKDELAKKLIDYYANFDNQK